MRRAFGIAILLCVLGLFAARVVPSASLADSPAGPIVLLRIEGTINPATADYLRAGLEAASLSEARLVVLQLNTPGGLLPSMQLMVESLLQSKVPTVVYVSPRGGGAMSAGMFITLAGNFAVMAPGTTIGAAHPVLNGGSDITGDMGQKIENFSVSLAKAIAEQRGRNVKWAEEAVRESVSATDREAQADGIIDFIAGDLDRLLSDLEGKSVNAAGRQVTLTGLRDAPRREIPMSLKQKVLNVLADPNIAMLVGMGALLGLGIELYHPGALFPGIFGAICLVLSLVAGQVLPITTGGIVLMLLGAAFCLAEAFVPSFGILGIVGTICVATGAIYAIDEDQVFSASSFDVDRVSIFGAAFLVGSCFVFIARQVMKSRSRKVTTGREGLVGKEARVLVDFNEIPGEPGKAHGKVRVMGEIWKAVLDGEVQSLPKRDEALVVRSVSGDMTLVVGVKK